MRVGCAGAAPAKPPIRAASGLQRFIRWGRPKLAGQRRKRWLTLIDEDTVAFFTQPRLPPNLTTPF